MARRLGRFAPEIEERWKSDLGTIFDSEPDAGRLRALTAMNPGASAEELAAGRFEDFFENVEYHARRLAKLDVAPSQTLESVTLYQRALLKRLKKEFPEETPAYAAALDRLYFCVRLTLNDAYYQVRDLEATAFYDVLQDQLEALTTKELLDRALETLTRTFRADAGVIVLAEPQASRLDVRACRGITRKAARTFAQPIGEGFSGVIAASGQSDFIVDASEDERAGKAAAEGLFSIWGVPLLVRGRVTGVVLLGFDHEYHCLPRERKLLEAIAERCALAIDKARLLEELHEREERIRKLSEHMVRVEEEERRRISRELHDEVGQSLLVVRLNLEMIERDVELEKGAEVLGPKLEATRKVCEDTIVEMRRLISKLSPSVLQEMGLPASIRQFVKNLNRSFPGRIRMLLEEVDELPERAKIMMYRLVQECLTNAVKHSEAQNVTLELMRQNGVVRMRMRDDGVGFDLSEALCKRESFGLSGMQERVALLGGEIEFETSPGEGAQVSIAIPV